MRLLSLCASCLAVVLAAATASPRIAAVQGRRGGGGSDAPDAGQQPAARGDSRRPQKRDAPEDFSQKYFEICDYSKDGWISFGEAESALRIDRAGYAVYDVDRDGRIDFEEFRTRYMNVVRNEGSFPPPLPKSPTRKAPRRSPDELLGVYDKNGDGALDTRELKPVLVEYGVEDITPEKLCLKLDNDSSGKLELVELSAVVSVLSPRVGPSTRRAPRVASIEELFGRVYKRDGGQDSSPEPPMLPGPVSAFRRLDIDNDGSISTRDLFELQRPLQLSVRIPSVIASLDTDGDGVVSKQEFWAAMGSSKP